MSKQSLQDEIARLESIIEKHQWHYIRCVDGSLQPVPEHSTEVLFEYAGRYIAGKFFNDLRPSTNPEGEPYEGDYGFFDNDDEFYEIELVQRWMRIYE